MKSHRDFASARSPDDSCQILGNQVADETAKLINIQEFHMLKEVTDNISEHSKLQLEAIHSICQHLVDLHGLHLKLKKTTFQIEIMETVDFYATFRDRLRNWQITGPKFLLQGEFHPVVEHGSFLGRKVTRHVESLPRAPVARSSISKMSP